MSDDVLSVIPTDPYWRPERAAADRTAALLADLAPGLPEGVDVEIDVDWYGPVHQLDTVQLDTDHGAELVDSPAQLERYHLVLDRMHQAALPPAKSRDFIARLAQDL
ncbi:Scr1 family TA system antitoxin-like transcriptional regulator [Streptomyces sp. NPDC058086]|uniref:Scr1 family TA system antitoxin-like transcriptional regulator n=1 Tax=Streptomyces sp. NPDC058086 TaxID=3346334 RepID=UPI0036ED6066